MDFHTSVMGINTSICSFKYIFQEIDLVMFVCSLLMLAVCEIKYVG